MSDRYEECAGDDIEFITNARKNFCQSKSMKSEQNMNQDIASLMISLDTLCLEVGEPKLRAMVAAFYRRVKTDTIIGDRFSYHLPSGPIRINYGHNSSRRTGKSGGMLHITVGFAF
jgi:hypothetical protein